MSTYLQSARDALKHHRKSKSTQEIKAKLGLRYAEEVHRRVNVAQREETYLEARLTPDELTLIMNVGRAQLRQLEHGDICSPKLKYCGGLFWPRGKAERIARKRLNDDRKGDEVGLATGLGLLCAYHGGYVILTRAGWALFHAIEAERQGGAA